jgi:hypothetical protein
MPLSILASHLDECKFRRTKYAMPLATTKSRTDIEAKRRNMTGLFQFAEIQRMLENLGLWSGPLTDRQYAYYNGAGDLSIVADRMHRMAAPCGSRSAGAMQFW